MEQKTLPEYGIHHVGYVVKNREEAIQAFSDSCRISDVKLIHFKAGRAWLYGKEIYGNEICGNEICGNEICDEAGDKKDDALPVSSDRAPYEMKIAMLTLADHPTAIEIIEPLTAGPHMDFVLATGGGIHHIGFDVNDAYDYWKEQLSNGGAKPLFESETEDEIVGYRRCLYVKDQGGNVIEVKETPRFR